MTDHPANHRPLENCGSVLVVGCGSIGRRHLRNLAALGAHRMVAFDPLLECRQAVVAETGGRVVERLEDAWSHDPRVVLVATPPAQHLAVAWEAASRGCDLFIEKPLSHRLDGVNELEQEIARRHLVAMVACNMRFHPGPATVKKLLEEWAIGQVLAARLQTGSYLPAWRPQQDYRRSYSASPEWGGAVLDCIHEIDLALWYFGPASCVGAAVLPATTLGLEADGLAEILLRHESGVLSSIHLNFMQRDYHRTCQIIGSEGTLYWDFAWGRVDLHGLDGALKRSFPAPEGWELNQMYLDEIVDFFAAVAERRPATSPFASGAAALRVALAARCWALENRI